MKDTAAGFARLAGGFWRRETRRRAWFLTFALVAAIAGIIIVNLSINRWNGWFFNALEKRDGAVLVDAILVFPLLVLAAAAAGVALVLARETLQVRWREWIARDLVRRWLEGRAYYRLSEDTTSPDNPEYRIADETRLAVEPLVDLFIGLIQAFLTAMAFLTVLWVVGGSLSLPVGGGTVTIPAYLVLAALAYGLTASGLTYLVGKPLVARVAVRNQAEGDFRMQLMRVRENAEAVALSGDEALERRRTGGLYDEVVRRWLAVVRKHGQLTWIIHANAVMVVTLPALLAAPKFVAGQMTLGDVMQVAPAFVQVQFAMAWLVDNFRQIAICFASMRRILELSQAIEAVSTDEAQAERQIAVVRSEELALRLEEVSIADRDGRTLIAPVSLSIAPGERVEIIGPSGSGKSVLVRAISGLWSYGSGVVQRPDAARISFLHSQERFDWSLMDDEGWAAAGVDLTAVLERLDLREIAERMTASGGSIEQTVSGGERQRLALARAVASAPDFLVLDAAIDALDDEEEGRVLSVVCSLLPGTGIIYLRRGGAPVLPDARVLTLARRGKPPHPTMLIERIRIGIQAEAEPAGGA
jgi:putative ATP-binding cassette transporter